MAEKTSEESPELYDVPSSEPLTYTISKEGDRSTVERNDDPPTEEGKIFVGGLSWETTNESLQAHFEQYGQVIDSVVMRDPASGQSRGFGFVTFADPTAVDRLLKHSHRINGKTVDPKRAIPRAEQGRHPPVQEHRTKKIFVGGLAPHTSENDFRDYFAAFGTVTDAVLMTDRETGRPRGFGFITFDAEDAVDTVMNSPSHIISDKEVEVKRAEPRYRSSRTYEGSSSGYEESSQSYSEGGYDGGSYSGYGGASSYASYPGYGSSSSYGAPPAAYGGYNFAGYPYGGGRGSAAGFPAGYDAAAYLAAAAAAAAAYGYPGYGGARPMANPYAAYGEGGEKQYGGDVEEYSPEDPSSGRSYYSRSRSQDGDRRSSYRRGGNSSHSSSSSSYGHSSSGRRSRGYHPYERS